MLAMCVSLLSGVLQLSMYVLYHYQYMLAVCLPSDIQQLSMCIVSVCVTC